VVVFSIACAWLTATRLQVSGDLTSLFPTGGEAAALVRWTHAFDGQDAALVLVRGKTSEDVEHVATTMAELLRHAPSVQRVLDQAPSPALPSDPTLAWAFADGPTRARLAKLVEPDGMRERLAGTREMLLAPVGVADAETWLARDPLRLASVQWESRRELAAGVASRPGAAFATEDGLARLVVVQPRGSAFVSQDAAALVADVEKASRSAARQGVTVELAGGHAVARATERMLEFDLALSGVLSLGLASLAFVLTFRRVRALLAVLPPLILGTLWTTGLAAFLPRGLSAVAVAFAAVVVGVGVDTGVHVYAALLDGRREGLAPARAAARARDVMWRPTLSAAAAAAAAFASLALGGLEGMRELGLLCGAGEVLTAIAILLVTPEVGAWLERGPPPPALQSRWINAVAAATATRRRAWLALGACAIPAVAIAMIGWPKPADALVALRPRALEPLVVQERIYSLFGGRPGQWIVLSTDASELGARARADRIAEALAPLAAVGQVEGFDSIATFAPAPDTQRARLAERDALNLPARRATLVAALRDTGFDAQACAPAQEAFAHPAYEPVNALSGDPDTLTWLYGRHVAHDKWGTLVATYVRVGPKPSDADAVRVAIRNADPSASITGFDALDRALRVTLGRSLWAVGLSALALVATTMALALRSVRDTLVALAALAAEMAFVGVAMRILSVRWHVFDALVLPVLFGVTIDESMFLLHASRTQTVQRALCAQGPLVSATALTTAAGFAALTVCRFDGLRDLGMVGALGVLVGLVASLIVVPAALTSGRVSGGIR
jgi:predicted exporter